MPETISALRVLDVLAWMDGKGYAKAKTTPLEIAAHEERDDSPDED